jgi:hypothetical protein
LPAAAADGVAAVGPPMLPLGRSETVLIIESEPDRLLRDKEMAAALGYEPVGYRLRADAIAACRSAPDRFDVRLRHPLMRTSESKGTTRRLMILVRFWI